MKIDAKVYYRNGDIDEFSEELSERELIVFMNQWNDFGNAGYIQEVEYKVNGVKHNIKYYKSPSL